MDPLGGGRTIADLLQSRKFMEPEGKELIWELDNPDHMALRGPRILLMPNPTSDWNSETNHSMRSAIERFTIILPVMDLLAIEEELVSFGINDIETGSIDTLEKVTDQIEEMKREMITIQREATQTGKERFVLPKEQQSDTIPLYRRRKDRYSACLLASFAVFNLSPNDARPQYTTYGGTTAAIVKEQRGGGAFYIGLPEGEQTVSRKISSRTTGSGRRVYF